MISRIVNQPRTIANNSFGLDSASKVCRICGSNAGFVQTGRVINNYPLSRCTCCDTVLIEKQPAPEDIARIYNYLFEKGEYEQHRIEFETLKSGKMPPSFFRRWLTKRVENICGGRTLIEIGGGTGGFGVLARSRGWKYTNYDISTVAVNFCRELDLEANIFSYGSLPPLLPQSADVVAMWEVIEHVWDVHGYLKVIKDALNDKGIFLFSTPNYLAYYDWGPLSAPPVHMNFFTKDSLEKTLRLCGFKTHKVSKWRFARPNLSFSGVNKFLRTVSLLDEPETLFGIARRD